MIDLSNFNDLVSRTGSTGMNKSYIRIGDNECKLILGDKHAKEVRQYLGNTLNVKVSGDLEYIVLMRGNDRRLSNDRSVSVFSLRQQYKEKFGDSIKFIHLDVSWDEDERGVKVLVLHWNGKKEYAADMTIHKLKG